jgi:hypothetical protein
LEIVIAKKNNPPKIAVIITIVLARFISFSVVSSAFSVKNG